MPVLPRICLIYTGGTIGMRRLADGTLCPPQDPSSFLQIAPQLGTFCQVDFVALLNKDSANLTPADWSAISRAIDERLSLGYAGFVIAHGTDTMHYSASAVALALGRPPLPCPVVFTGAQAAPDAPDSDAQHNLLDACRVALEDLAEVVIVFAGRILRGCRAQKRHASDDDAFESPAHPPLGRVGERIELSSECCRRPERSARPSELKATFSPGLITITLTPGLDPALIEHLIADPSRCKGLILQVFGAGNVPSEPPFDLTRVIRQATKSGIPVLLTSPFPAGSTLDSAYQSGKLAVQAGAIPTGNMTAACAAVKFSWVLAQVQQHISAGTHREDERIELVRTMMQTLYVGEMDPQRHDR